MQWKLSAMYQWIKRYAFISGATAILILGSQLAHKTSWMLSDMNYSQTREFCAPAYNAIDSIDQMVMQRHTGRIVTKEVTDHIDCETPTIRVTWEFKSRSAEAIETSRTISSMANAEGLRILLHESKFSTAQDQTHIIPAMAMAAIALAWLQFQRRFQVYIGAPLSKVHRISAIIAGASLGIALVLLFWLHKVGLHALGLEAPQPGFSTPSKASFTGMLTIVVFVPLFEEIVFRAWLLEAWRKIMHPSIALLLSSAAFAAIHPYSLQDQAWVFLIGLALGTLWLKTRSLLLCSATHASYNLLALWLLMTLATP